MATKNEPGRFNCYAKAEPDEPTFTLLARDPVAAQVVRDWVRRRIDIKLLKDTHYDQITEAASCAYAMEKWYKEHRQ